jgi:hypothetical protein
LKHFKSGIQDIINFFQKDICCKWLPDEVDALVNCAAGGNKGNCKKQIPLELPPEKSPPEKSLRAIDEERLMKISKLVPWSVMNRTTKNHHESLMTAFDDGKDKGFLNHSLKKPIDNV